MNNKYRSEQEGLNGFQVQKNLFLASTETMLTHQYKGKYLTTLKSTRYKNRNVTVGNSVFTFDHNGLCKVYDAGYAAQDVAAAIRTTGISEVKPEPMAAATVAPTGKQDVSTNQKETSPVSAAPVVEEKPKPKNKGGRPRKVTSVVLENSVGKKE